MAKQASEILSAAEVRAQLPTLSEALSKADFDRLESIITQFESGQAEKASLANCLNAIASDRMPERQLADFRAFRTRLRKAASASNLGLQLEVDSKKRSIPAEYFSPLPNAE